MTAPSFTVTIHGKAKFDQPNSADDFIYLADEGRPPLQPYNLLSTAIAAAEKAVATSSFYYNQMALDFISERISVRDQSGSLLFSALVKDAQVQWIPLSEISSIQHV